MKRCGIMAHVVLPLAIVAGMTGCGQANPTTNLSPLAGQDPERFQRALAAEQAHQQALAEGEAKFFRGRQPALPE